ncbi:hypothetical protein [Ilumatobacter sp.]|uniref:hypothetical protein n=1 Tax=Ilumatobacter sp. TaxID=1967498 RepID=UPI003AF45750
MSLGTHARPARMVALTVATAALAVALLDQLVRVRILQGDGAVSSVPFVALAVLLVLSEVRPTTWTRVGERDGVTRGWAFAYALILLGNPILAITVMVATRCYVDLSREKTSHEIIFDSVQIVASLSLGSLVLAAFGVRSNIADATTISIVASVGIVAAGLAIFVLNGLLTATVIGLEQDADFVRAAGAAFALGWTADGALIALAPMFALAAASRVAILALVVTAAYLLAASARSALRRRHDATPLLVDPPVEIPAIEADVIQAVAIESGVIETHVIGTGVIETPTIEVRHARALVTTVDRA